MKGDIERDRGGTTLRFLGPKGKMSLVIKKDRPDVMEGVLARQNASYAVRMKRVLEE